MDRSGGLKFEAARSGTVIPIAPGKDVLDAISIPGLQTPYVYVCSTA